MARKPIDETLLRILKEYDEDSSAVWDCHGTWVAYHAAIERIAAKAAITFDPPTVIESNGAQGIVSICVTGRMGDKAEWSFGEATPKNNKNAYPYAMAEKRAKDRVVLKLVGLHGQVYSEEEADDFKPPSPPPANTDLDEQTIITDLKTQIKRVSTEVALDKLRAGNDFIAAFRSLSEVGKDKIAEAGAQRRAELKSNLMAAG